MYSDHSFTVSRKIYPLVACICIAGLLLVSAPRAYSQVEDTSSVVANLHKHSPQKAVLYSLVFPGLGQIYNRKYWKLPIIYGAGGAFAYYVLYNQLKYQKFRDAVIDGAATEADAVIDGVKYPYSILDRGRDGYRRNRDLSVAGLGAIYLLNVIDAMVDAHFFYYDVSDDLSMRVQPALLDSPGNTATLGFRINLEF